MLLSSEDEETESEASDSLVSEIFVESILSKSVLEIDDGVEGRVFEPINVGGLEATEGLEISCWDGRRGSCLSALLGKGEESSRSRPRSGRFLVKGMLSGIECAGASWKVLSR